MDDITIIDDPGYNSAFEVDADGTQHYYPARDSSVSSAAGAGSSYDWLASLFGNFNSNNDNSEIFKEYMNFIRDNTNYNNAWSAQQAQNQMDFQNQQRIFAQNFNASEAAKNRSWQQYMSNTSHQREVADLKAAGLNPVLSASGGNGAAVGSGASASISQAPGSKGETDESANMAITSLLSGFLSSMMNLEGQRINAQSSLAVAEKYTAMEKIIQEMKQTYGKWEHENYPSSIYEAMSALIKGLTGDDFNTRAGNTGSNAKGLWSWISGKLSGKSSSGFSGRGGKIDGGSYSGSKPWYSAISDWFSNLF